MKNFKKLYLELKTLGNEIDSDDYFKYSTFEFDKSNLEEALNLLAKSNNSYRYFELNNTIDDKHIVKLFL